MAESKAFSQISFDAKNIANGEYEYMYSVGLYSKHETGQINSEGKPIVTGQYRYVLGDKQYVVIYTADKDGFHPKVTILEYGKPQPPPATYPPQVVATILGK